MLNEEQKNSALEKAGFKCQKCGYSSAGIDLEVLPINDHVLCSICAIFAPETKEALETYLNEKIDWQVLETFRNSGINRASHNPHKQGMIEKSKQGKLVARPPFGYKVKKGELIVDEENSEKVLLIFKEFAAGKSLNYISKNYNLSVNGLKKILKNFAYLGKIKFAGNISQGTHKPLITNELFNEVQSRFEKKNNKEKTE
jgi:hypothetical protein